MLKLRTLLAAAILLTPMPALAASYVWNPQPVGVRTSTGAVASGAKAYFFLEGTTTPLTTYSDAAQTTPNAHPVVANSQGVFSPVYIPYSATGYKVRVTTSGGTTIQEIDGIARNSPPESGGGGGIVVATEQVLQPGDIKWRCATGTHSGFVRANGRTIGNAASSATERANADTEDLFEFLWTNCANAQCAVSGGRGASAAADFAANKNIATFDLRGRGLVNFDDAGNSAANVAQVSPTIDTTNGSPTITVSSATGVVIGQTIVSTNVPAGTTVSAVSGTTVTMSGNATATASGTAARFSQFGDAHVVASPGGGSTRTLVIAEMPTHTHVQDAHSHSYTNHTALQTGGNGGAPIAEVNTGQTTSTSGSQTATNQNTGSSRPHGLQNPALICGALIKL